MPARADGITVTPYRRGCKRSALGVASDPQSLHSAVRELEGRVKASQTTGHVRKQRVILTPGPTHPVRRFHETTAATPATHSSFERASHWQVRTILDPISTAIPSISSNVPPFPGITTARHATQSGLLPNMTSTNVALVTVILLTCVKLLFVRLVSGTIHLVVLDASDHRLVYLGSGRHFPDTRGLRLLSKQSSE